MSLPPLKGPPRVFGWCPWSPARVLSAIEAGGACPIPGDFVLVGRTRQGGVLIVSSPLAATPYYWTPHPELGLVHGPTVFDVVERANLPWRWHHAALRALAMLEHPLGDDTLHPSVRRCPPGTALWSSADGRVHRHRYHAPHELFRGHTSLPHALAVFRTVHAEMDSPSPVVSLSSGLDSRLLLASLLSRGHVPRCATMGGLEATDVRVARQIAADLGLTHELITLRPRDYLRWGQQAVAVSSGGKSARHFHTYIYAQRLGLSPNDLHHVGSNGEFARSMFFDAGALGRALDAVHAPLMHITAMIRIHSRIGRSALRNTALGARRLDVARSFARRATRRLGSLDRLDELMAYQRVRRFIGNGLAMYATASRVVSPFVDVRWMQAVGGLPRADKQGGNFHRHAIDTLYPALLRYPTDDADRALSPRAPRLYALRKGSTSPYAPVAEVVALPEVAQRVIETPQLDALVSRADRIEAIARRDVPLVCLLLTLHWTVEILRERGIEIASDEPVTREAVA